MLDIKNVKCENRVEIVGTVNEMDFSFRTSNSGKEYGTANIYIRVDQEINGTATENIVPVKMFAMKEKKDGTLNPNYTTIQKAKEDLVSLANCPEDQLNLASRVRISNGVLSENFFIGQDGEVKSSSQITTNFLNISSTSQDEDKACFECTGIVLKKSPEVNSDGEETGRLILKIGIVQWGGKMDMITMIAESPSAVTFINENWEERDTVRLTGQIKMTKNTITWYEPQGFGPDLKRSKTTSCREFIITGGSPGCLDEMSSYDVNSISAALRDRKQRMEDEKEKRKKIENKKKSFDF